ADDRTSNLWKIAGTGNYYEVEFKEKVKSDMLSSLPFIINVSLQEKGTWLLEAKKGEDIREAVFNFATEKRLHILSLSQSEQSMEEVFHLLTLK
ncbi:MAG: hypothetical protein DRJ09_09940, partial [Bacteroidetes bacterium]